MTANDYLILFFILLVVVVPETFFVYPRMRWLLQTWRSSRGPQATAAGTWQERNRLKELNPNLATTAVFLAIRIKSTLCATLGSLPGPPMRWKWRSTYSTN